MESGKRYSKQNLGGQIMFDLKNSIFNWKSSLKNNESFTSENIDELESHLNEQIIDLKETGLSDEEAFWIAQKRIGSMETLVPEYEKINNLAIFRKRIFWMLNGIVMMLMYIFFISTLSDGLIALSLSIGVDLLYAKYADFVLGELIFVIVSIVLIQIFVSRNDSRLKWITSSPFLNGVISGKRMLFFYFSFVGILALLFLSYYYRPDLNLMIARSSSFKEYRELTFGFGRIILMFNSVVMLIIYHISFRSNKRHYVSVE